METDRSPYCILISELIDSSEFVDESTATVSREKWVVSCRSVIRNPIQSDRFINITAACLPIIGALHLGLAILHIGRQPWAHGSDGRRGLLIGAPLCIGARQKESRQAPICFGSRNKSRLKSQARLCRDDHTRESCKQHK